MVTVSELKTLEALQIIDRCLAAKDRPELTAGYELDGVNSAYIELFREGKPRIEIDDMDSFGAALVALAERLQAAQP